MLADAHIAVVESDEDGSLGWLRPAGSSRQPRRYRHPGIPELDEPPDMTLESVRRDRHRRSGTAQGVTDFVVDQHPRVVELREAQDHARDCRVDILGWALHHDSHRADLIRHYLLAPQSLSMARRLISEKGHLVREMYRCPKVGGVYGVAQCPCAPSGSKVFGMSAYHL